MPWKETCKMEERFKFVQEVNDDAYSFAESCRRFGISRTIGYKWMERYEYEGLPGLANRSRAPHRCPHAVDQDTEQAIVALRSAHPQWGPRKLRVNLTESEPTRRWPAASTIGELLRRQGLSVPRSRRRKATPSRAPSTPFATNTTTNGPTKPWGKRRPVASTRLRRGPIPPVCPRSAIRDSWWSAASTNTVKSASTARATLWAKRCSASAWDWLVSTLATGLCALWIWP